MAIGLQAPKVLCVQDIRVETLECFFDCAYAAVTEVTAHKVLIFSLVWLCI